MVWSQFHQKNSESKKNLVFSKKSKNSENVLKIPFIKFPVEEIFFKQELKVTPENVIDTLNNKREKQINKTKLINTENLITQLENSQEKFHDNNSEKNIDNQEFEKFQSNNMKKLIKIKLSQKNILDINSYLGNQENLEKNKIKNKISKGKSNNIFIDKENSPNIYENNNYDKNIDYDLIKEKSDDYFPFLFMDKSIKKLNYDLENLKEKVFPNIHI